MIDCSCWFCVLFEIFDIFLELFADFVAAVTIMRSQSVFRPFKFLNFALNNDVALVLLNQKWCFASGPSQKFLNFFGSFWKKSCFSASVDGGTNTLHVLNKHENYRFVPDLISGDFDSITPELLEIYKAKGTEIIRTPDQDYTDFTKCLKILSQKFADNQLQSLEHILCLVSESDRVDHVLSNINTLLTSKTDFPSHVNICLLSPDSCTFLLSPGHTLIDLETFGFPKPEWCCLLPIQSPAVVTTSGLVSNFRKRNLKIGSFNFRYKLLHTEDFIVDTDKPLVLVLPMELF